jgi:GAF domain-containing protein
MLESVPDATSHLVDALSAITAQLVDDSSDSGSTLYQIAGTCVNVLEADAAGIMVVDPRGGVAVVAASDERARLVELLQTQIDQGPCIDCMRTSEIVAASDLREFTGRWPDFTSAVLEAGYRSVLAVPMRLDGRTVGGLNLLYTRTEGISAHDRGLSVILARLAVLGLTQEVGEPRTGRLAERTMSLLNDRVHVGHATGLVAGTLGIAPAAARAALEDYAQGNCVALRDVARRITEGTVRPAELLVRQS